MKNLFRIFLAAFLLTAPTFAWANIKTATTGQKIGVPKPGSAESGLGTSAARPKAATASYQLNWISVNGGGAINTSSANYQLGLSVAQPVAGAASSSSYQMGIGFWYGVPGAPACGASKGDLNGVGGLTPADVVLMLNCVFLANGAGTLGGDCNLCYSDVNCSGNLSPADAVIELNYVFLGTPPPC